MTHKWNLELYHMEITLVYAYSRYTGFSNYDAANVLAKAGRRGLG